MALVLIGVLTGMLLITPSTAHFSQNTKHLGSHAWKQVIKQKVYTKQQANAIAPRVTRASRSTTLSLTTADQIYISQDVTAPTRGYVLLNATVTFQAESACTGACGMAGFIQHAQTFATSIGATTNLHTAGDRASIALTTVMAVSKGSNTFNVLVARGANGAVLAVRGEMTALFSRFGGA
ncbi:MAG TPA: hypothetical protein VF058_02625 [Actinomycetota bacterium]